MDNIEFRLRKLARSQYWQTLYKSSKDCSGITLFENQSNFSYLQSRFLYWVAIYDMLYSELNTLEDKYLTEKVIEDDVRCFDKETEVLTDKGWKYFKDLDKTETVATLNINNRNIEYQKPTDYIIQKCEGKLWHLKTSQLDICSTDNHRHLLLENNNLVFKETKEIYNKFHLYFLRVGNWIGKDVMNFCLLGTNKINKWRNGKFKIYKTPNINISMKNWIKFLAWYLSEGNCWTDNKGNYRIRIAQKKKENFKIIKDILNNLPFHWGYWGTEYCINSKELFIYLNKFGKTKQKYIPDYIKLSSKETIRDFLYNYMLGDGHKTSSNRFWISTSSLQMRDDLMELGFKAGYAVTYKKHIIKDNWNINFLDNKPTSHSSKNYRISTWVDYDDYVYCVEVPNQTLFIRRNGKTAWSGNCDAYLIRRNKRHEHEWKKHRQEEAERESRNRHPNRHKKGNMNESQVELRRE